MYKIQEQFAGTALPENNQDENRPSAANTYDMKIETEQETAFIKEEFTPSYTQINLSYIVVSTKTGFLLVDQQLAHQRILYERFEQVTSTPISIQKCLLPQTFELPPSDAILLLGMLPDLLELGYEVEEFGKNSFILQGIPADVKQGNEISSIEKILEAFKHASSDVRLDKRERLIRTLAMQRAIQHGKKLSEREMERLMQDLFVCEQPQLSPTGKKIFAKLSSHDIDVLINNA
jgi:DNA mismatch repair protein MutL